MAPHREVDAQALKGTKGTPLVRYTNFLTKPEFSKLVNLMRDLAPSLVVLMKPANEARIRSGCWEAVRENLLLVLEATRQRRRCFNMMAGLLRLHAGPH